MLHSFEFLLIQVSDGTLADTAALEGSGNKISLLPEQKHPSDFRFPQPNSPVAW